MTQFFGTLPGISPTAFNATYLCMAMSLFTSKGVIIVTCPKRLAPYVEQDIKEIGFEPEETFVTGVRLAGTLNDCIKLNLNLRCASQVLFSLKQFEADNADDIYKNLIDYPWENILPEDSYFSITSNVNNPTINNSMFANLRVKDAIVDRLRDKRGSRPSTGSALTGAVIHLFWKNEHAEVFIDSTGDSLGRHGYRKIPGQAPMLEALAAATILASRWDRKSPFVNPMCGSGTVAIEAAMIATNRRPGLYRTNYAFMHLQGYDDAVYQREDGLLEDQIIDVPGLRIIASDYSRRAVENSTKNAIAAGVVNLIDFQVCDFADTEIPPDVPGIFYVNPEYGERLGDEGELEKTYKRIGDFMKQKCGGYTGYVFTGNIELGKRVGLKPKRRIEFYTSTIDCRLFEYELYSGSKSVPVTEPNHQ
jgi:putative N6-adenine-specific DNA methylase